MQYKNNFIWRIIFLIGEMKKSNKFVIINLSATGKLEVCIMYFNVLLKITVTYSTNE